MSTDIHTLVGAYALDAVDDIERAAFDRHIVECASCRAELDELRETASRLVDTTWSVPPPRLRNEVLAAVARTRQLPPAAPVPSARRDKTRPGRRLVAVAAAVVLAGGTGAAVYSIQEQRVREREQIAAAAQQREARTRQILASPDVVVRTSPMIGGGKVTVASSELQNAGVVMLGADAPPSDGRAFQLWTIRGTTPRNAGVLAAGQTSAVQVLDGLPGSDAFAVTAEPAGGSTTPTFPLVAQVPLV